MEFGSCPVDFDSKSFGSVVDFLGKSNFPWDTTGVERPEEREDDGVSGGVTTIAGVESLCSFAATSSVEIVFSSGSVSGGNCCRVSRDRGGVRVFSSPESLLRSSCSSSLGVVDCSLKGVSGAVRDTEGGGLLKRAIIWDTLLGALPVVASEPLLTTLPLSAEFSLEAFVLTSVVRLFLRTAADGRWSQLLGGAFCVFLCSNIAARFPTLDGFADGFAAAGFSEIGFCGLVCAVTVVLAGSMSSLLAAAGASFVAATAAGFFWRRQPRGR